MALPPDRDEIEKLLLERPVTWKITFDGVTIREVPARVMLADETAEHLRAQNQHMRETPPGEPIRIGHPGDGYGLLLS